MANRKGDRGQGNLPARALIGQVVAETGTGAFLGQLIQNGRLRIRLAFGLGAAAGLLWIAQAWLIATAVSALAQDRANLPSALLLLGFAILAFLRIGLSAAANRLAFLAAASVKQEIRARISAALGSWSPVDSFRPSSGEAAALVADHVDALEPYLTRFEPARSRLLILPLAVLVVTLFHSWVAALILLISGPLIPLFMALIGLRAKAASERQLAEMLAINGYLADRLSGLLDIKLLGAEEIAGARLERHALHLKDATMAVLRVAFLSSAVLELFAALGVALVAVYVGFNLLGYFAFGDYGSPLSLGTGLLVLMLAPEFFMPLRDYAAAYHDRATALAAAEALRRILDGDHKLLPAQPNADTQMAGTRPPSISICDLSFKHVAAPEPLFTGLNLDIASGEHLAVVGPSGSGKSTLIALIGALTEPDSGKILVNGTDPITANPEAWRARIAWVGQRPHFLKTTLRRNLTLGRDGIGREDIEAAVHAAGAAGVLARMPEGWSTLLGEGAQGLSRGEAQRMAIARAYLAHADLILADEPTAHLDPETAERVGERLLALARDKTLVVATHDPKLAARMDRSIMLGPNGRPD